MHSSATSFNSVAEDRILGKGMFLKGGKGLVVRQIRPIGLSLFELGILIDVIHNEEPDYSPIKNTILEVVKILFPDNLNKTPVPDPKDDLLYKIADRYLERRNKEFSKVHDDHNERSSRDKEKEDMQREIESLLQRIDQLEKTGSESADIIAGH